MAQLPQEIENRKRGIASRFGSTPINKINGYTYESGYTMVHYKKGGKRRAEHLLKKYWGAFLNFPKKLSIISMG